MIVKNKKGIKGVLDIIIALVLSATIVLISLLPGIGGTMANPVQAGEEASIINFELTNPVFEKRVSAGTTLEELSLPTVLRAILMIEDAVDIDSEPVAGSEGSVTTPESVVSSDGAAAGGKNEKDPSGEGKLEDTLNNNEETLAVEPGTYKAGEGAGETGTTATGEGETGTAETGEGETGTDETGTAATGKGETGTDEIGTAATGEGETGTSETGTAATGEGETGTNETGTSVTGEGETGESVTGRDNAEKVGQGVDSSDKAATGEDSLYKVGPGGDSAGNARLGGDGTEKAGMGRDGTEKADPGGDSVGNAGLGESETSNAEPGGAVSGETIVDGAVPSGPSASVVASGETVTGGGASSESAAGEAFMAGPAVSRGTGTRNAASNSGAGAIAPLNTADGKPEAVQTGAADKHESVQTGDTDNPIGVQTGATNNPIGVQTGATDNPIGVQTGDAGKPEGVQTGAADKPEGVQTGATDKPEGVQTGASDKPESEQTGDADKPEGIQTGAGEAPSVDNAGYAGSSNTGSTGERDNGSGFAVPGQSGGTAGGQPVGQSGGTAANGGGHVTAVPDAIHEFIQTEPLKDEDGIYEYIEYGYIAPEEENLLRELGQLVIYTLIHDDGSEDYRVHGTLNGENEGFYSCDEFGNIIGFVSSIPVTWEGAYDGNTPGTYILKAGIEGFEYIGELPTAIITVSNSVMGPGSIMGVLTVEDDGVPSNGRRHGQALEGGIIRLYLTSNTNVPLSKATSDKDGVYIFENLEPGKYVLGLWPKTEDGEEYVLPTDFTEDNKFAVDEYSSQYVAYTEAIELEAGQTVEDINAIMSPLGDNTPTHFIIPIGDGSQPNGSYTGYTLSGDVVGQLVITFNKDANEYTYEITQARDSHFRQINIPDGVKTTLTLNNINSTLFINLEGTADVRILLKGANRIDEAYINVPERASITFDSAVAPGTGSTEGSLTIESGSYPGYALIGGYQGVSPQEKSHSGLITIKGGTITAKQTKTDSPTPTAAAIGGGGGTDGNVVITGGNVTAEVSRESSGAAIGGGQDGTGNVLITGGAVTAAVPAGGTSNGSGGTSNVAGGAAIGGGQGDGSPTSGIGNVDITGGSVTASAISGAAIGSGMLSGNAKVNISGGEIKATTAGTGAAIGGGGGMSPDGSDAIGIAGSVNVNITGGDINLLTNLGAGIGNGGYQGSNVPQHSETISGVVNIAGGRISAVYRKSNGAIGSGGNNKHVPLINIDAKADIVAFGIEGSYFPGIYTAGSGYSNQGENKGSAYYVNGFYYVEDSFDNPNRKMFPSGLMVVHAAGDNENPLRVIEAPYAYNQFSFTTGAAHSQDFNVYVGADASSLRQIARENDRSPVIYSVNSTAAYIGKGHAPDNSFGSLHVAYSPMRGRSMITVTEKHVYIDGSPVVGLGDNTTMIVNGGGYGKELSELPEINGYTPKGYIWDNAPDGSGTDFELGDLLETVMDGDRTIYFVYIEYNDNTNVMVSKWVVGDLHNITEQFTFKVFMKDGNGIELPIGMAFTATGDIIPGSGADAPMYSLLVAGTGGVLTFTLGHGQMITLEGIPSDYEVSVKEVADSYYKASFSYNDREMGIVNGEGNIIGFMPVDLDGREFDFENEMIFVVPTGVEEGRHTAAMLVLLGGLLLLTLMAAYKIKIISKLKMYMKDSI